ncbi:hypothetical protein J4461_03335 [Candidatus Pacearchaeota archaeon]|nr:hypothetical protein [Candidatus Pacearchaeota archaeon]
MRVYNKDIYLVDVLLIGGVLLSGAILVGYSRPLVISPIDELNTYDKQVIFSLERGSSILIDDNADFSSPERIFFEDNLSINLKPGMYYWRAEGIINSKIYKLKVDSSVNLELKKSENSYELFNAGNVPINVTFFDNESIVSTNIIVIDGKEEVVGNGILGREE